MIDHAIWWEGHTHYAHGEYKHQDSKIELYIHYAAKEDKENEWGAYTQNNNHPHEYDKTYP